MNAGAGAMIVGVALCALGMATGILLIAASVVGFGRCPACRRFGQLTDSDGLIQCGHCWCRQARDFAGLDVGAADKPNSDR